MIKKIKAHTISFKHAFEGVVWVLKSQPNYQIHLFLSGLALVGGWFFSISYTEWIIITILIVIGLTIETINSSIEAVGDAIGNRWNEHIKHAKDASAAAMLIYAVGAIICSCIIFIPKILALIF